MITINDNNDDVDDNNNSDDKTDHILNNELQSIMQKSTYKKYKHTNIYIYKKKPSYHIPHFFSFPL